MGLIISDLGRPHDQSVVLDMLDNLRPISAHLGLPCGTCSRARDRPLPKELRSKFQAPPPLRDVDNLMGFPYLTGIHKTKVDAANSLYILAVQILKKCFTLRITVSIENPQRSWIWAILLHLVRQQADPAFLDWYAALEKVDFHSCMHGGRTPKKTRLLASPGLYTSLAQECDHSHEHLPWGVQQQGDSLFFSTADEAEYPHLLCKRMAQCLVDYSALKSIPLSSPQSSAQRARNAWGSQTSNSRPLIAEFRDFVYPTEALDTPGYRLLASPSTGATNTEMQVEHSGEEDPTDLQEADEVEPTNKRRRQTSKYGIQWHPEEFFEKAKEVGHPKDPQSALPRALKEALCQVLGNPPAEVAKFRFQVISAIKNKAAELEQQEEQLKASMDPSTAHVLKTKRICLWKYLLETTSFSDMGVVDLVKDGIPLYGTHSKPPNFPVDWRPASLSVTELLDSAVWRRKILMGSKGAYDDTMEDLHAATMKEVELGHLHGPFSEREISEFFGTSHWLFNPRFALYQGAEAKIRSIDDGKRSGLNLAYTTNFKLELFDVDTLAALIACVSDSLQVGRVDLDLGDKSVSMPVDSQVKQDSWLGRTLDLSRAYKQLAIDPKSRLLNVIGYLYKGEWIFFRCDVLPFGALAAVYSFNRVSRSIHHLICTLLWGLSTCFYDDFPTISPAGTSALLSKSMGILLTLLGWDHAKIGTKAIDFAADFNALGISVQLSSVNKGSFILCNKEGRIQKLCSMLEEVKLKGTISNRFELERPSSIWLERVASFSNPSDMPSRDQVELAAKLFNARATEELRVPDQLVSAITSLHGNPYATLNALFHGGQQLCVTGKQNS